MTRTVLTFLAMLFSGGAQADQRLDLAALRPLPPLAELVVRGTNTTTEPRPVVVRVDDRPSPEYPDRANEERIVPPGPFTLRLRLASLRTPRGRALDPDQVRQAIAFTPQAGVAVEGLTVEQPAALPQGTYGWFFGPADAAPLVGFRAVSVTDPAVSGPLLRIVHRPGQDPVLSWGMRLTRFEASLPPGRWHMTMWTEDPGDWETLPPVFERRIRLNGDDLLLERRSEADWVLQRYMAGRNVETDPSLPPFNTLGARRGGRVTADVSLPDGHFVLELAGHPQAATHLAAMTAAPADQPDAAETAVEAVRAARFAEAWPVLDRSPWHTGAADPTARLTIDGQTQATTAPGGLAVFRLMVHSPAPTAAHVALDGAGNGARVLWGMWRWRRPAPETPGLVLSAAHLRGDAATIKLRADLPRPLVIVVPIPADAPPGVQSFRISISTGLGSVSQSLRLDVLAVKRPAPLARVGPFLDFAPHLADDPDAARRQAACDLDTLRSLGLTAIAPPLTAPDTDMAPFLSDLRAAAARFAPPFVAYSPARRLAQELGVPNAAAAIARADAASRAAGLPPPVWTVADEPSAAGTLQQATELADQIRLADRDAILAGHLNDQADTRILPRLNLVTVNPRFGADAAGIAALRSAGHEPWLYNMPRLRLASGFYLWRSGAAGLLQWHARMPTADAFDPTDGREGDVQFLWPTPGICEPPDLDTDLLDMAEGEEDLRWLAWLEAASRSETPGASPLLRALRAEVPSVWNTAAALPAASPSDWRERIMGLARGYGQ